MLTQRAVEILSLDTLAGESAEEIIQRFSSKIDDISWEFLPVGGKNPDPLLKPCIEGKTTLFLPGPSAAYSHAFSGTETGLGIPAPPTSVSGSYRLETKECVFEWRCPSKGYDNLEDGLHAGHKISESTAVPLKTTHDYGFRMMHERGYDDLWIMGRRNGVPSNVAAIRVTSCAQEEFYSIPFTNGIAPNWAFWTYGDDDTVVKFEEGRREPFRNYPNGPIIVEEPGQKEFYQIIKSKDASASGGIFRHFFTLVPKHTYRLYIRVNTLEMRQVELSESMDSQAEWSFSIHMVANKSGERENLTSEQMAGFSPLPDGTTGIEAGQMLCYGSETTTGGKWIEHNTGDKRPGGIVGDITLPEDCDTITVWLRVSGNIASGVAMDWIKLEDLTVKAATAR